MQGKGSGRLLKVSRDSFLRNGRRFKDIPKDKAVGRNPAAEGICVSRSSLESPPGRFPGNPFQALQCSPCEGAGYCRPGAEKKSMESDVMSKYESAVAKEEKSNIVWVCWLQGRDAAPALVKSCISSLERNLYGRDIRVLDEKGIGSYVRFPEHIERKWKKGLIPPAAYSDLLRLELLIKYGGTWIDSTVFCSGPDYPLEYLDAGLFMFQFARAEDRRYSGISNWFITSSRPGNPVLMVLRDMLYRYWEDFDCFVYFFVFHLFFSMMVEREPRLRKICPMATVLPAILCKDISEMLSTKLIGGNLHPGLPSISLRTGLESTFWQTKAIIMQGFWK